MSKHAQLTISDLMVSVKLATQNAKDVSIDVTNVSLALLVTINWALPVSRPVTPTCLLITQLTSVFNVQINARLAAVSPSAQLVPILKLFLLMEFVTTALILAIAAHHPPQPVPHVFQDLI